MIRRLFALTLLAALGLGLAQLYFTVTHYRGFGTVNLAQLAAGMVDRPFVYRQLAAQSALVLARLTGLGLSAAGDVVIQAAMIGWLWSMYWLARAGLSERAALVAALAAAGPVGLLWVSGSYVYDIPHLALFTLALALLAHRKRLLYLALFPLVVLSKETALLLVAVYAVHAPRDWRALAMQLASFALVYGSLNVRFAANPGSVVQVHLWEHVAWLGYYPLPNLLALSLYVGALLAARHEWTTKPALLRAAAVTIPAMFLLYWLFGFPSEIRAVLEAYPALYLLAFHTVWHRAAQPTYQWLKRLSTPTTAKNSRAAVSISQ